MLRLDAIDLLDLSETGRALRMGPARLRRLIRRGHVPATPVDGVLGVPKAWVDAATGVAPVDEASVRTYWVERLAPPSADARRPRRDLASLEGASLEGASLDADGDLLDPAAAARRVFAHPATLPRLVRQGDLVPLRIHGDVRHDAALLDLVAASADPDVAREADARRGLLRELARFEYVDAEVLAPAPRRWVPAPPTPSAPERSARPKTASDSTTGPEAPAAPTAWEMPEDLLPPITPLPDRAPLQGESSDLAEADGFDTVDEL